jgi:hypothetical protein
MTVTGNRDDGGRGSRPSHARNPGHRVRAQGKTVNRTRILLIVGSVTVVLAAAVGISAALAGGNSNATVTLHGTYTELLYGMPLGQPCDSSISGEFGSLGNNQVQVDVDSVPAASVSVPWEGNVFPTQGTTACTGTWEATVPTARIAYQLKVTGSTGFPVTADVSPAEAGQLIVLNNAQTSPG